jgi:hypothetical protein
MRPRQLKNQKILRTTVIANFSFCVNSIVEELDFINLYVISNISKIIAIPYINVEIFV